VINIKKNSKIKNGHPITAIMERPTYHDLINHVASLLYHGILKNQIQNCGFEKNFTEREEIL
jgi:hypothetical protein